MLVQDLFGIDARFNMFFLAPNWEWDGPGAIRLVPRYRRGPIEPEFYADKALYRH